MSESEIYVGFGFEGIGTGIPFSNKWLQYNPISDEWIELRSCYGFGRANPYAFNINGKLYIGNGLRCVNSKYNPPDDPGSQPYIPYDPDPIIEEEDTQEYVTEMACLWVAPAVYSESNEAYLNGVAISPSIPYPVCLLSAHEVYQSPTGIYPDTGIWDGEDFIYPVWFASYMQINGDYEISNHPAAGSAWCYGCSVYGGCVATCRQHSPGGTWELGVSQTCTYAPSYIVDFE